MRRFKQQMPDEECVAVLTEACRGFLSVNGENGYPYTIPINFLYADGHIYFHCALEGHKMDAVKASDKVCFTVIDQPVQEPGAWWYHVRSVVCFGSARVVDDNEERIARLRQLGGKYFPEGYDIDADLQRNGPRAAILDMEITHMSGKRVNEK